MVAAYVAAVGVLACCLLVLMTVTVVGSRRRGSALPVAALAGLCFPVTWVVWYLRDERPYHRAPQ